MENHDDAVLAPDIVEDGMIMRVYQAWRMLRLFILVQAIAWVIVGAASFLAGGETVAGSDFPSFAKFSAVEAISLAAAAFGALGIGLAQVGWQRRGAVSSLRSLAPMIVLMIVILVAEPAVSLTHALTSPLLPIAVVLALLIGMTEETVFRGIMVGIFGGRTAPWTAALCSAVIFAAMHVPNYLGLPLKQVLVHVWFIFGVFGVPFALVYIRTGSILGLALVHAFWDGALFAGASSSGAVDGGMSAFDWIIPAAATLYYAIWFEYQKVAAADQRPFIERINLRPIKSRRLRAEAAERAHLATLRNPHPWLTSGIAESETRKPA